MTDYKKHIESNPEAKCLNIKSAGTLVPLIQGFPNMISGLDSICFL